MNGIQDGSNGDIFFTTWADAFANRQERIVGDMETHITFLSVSEQRDVVTYLWKNKPELLRDIICENCLEHTGEIK